MSISDRQLILRDPFHSKGVFRQVFLRLSWERKRNFISLTCVDQTSPGKGHLALSHGRMEFGPRVWGSRSILADPGTPR